MRGFTLIELLLVIAITTIIAGLSIPFLQSFQTSTDLYTHASTINRTLKRAQQQAIAGQNSSDWGVYFDTGSNLVTLFKGNDYASRDAGFDLETSFGTAFTITNDFSDEIFFSIFSGTPSVSGVATITNENSEEFGISISSTGLIQINE